MLKGLVHFKKQWIHGSFTHTHVIQDVHVFLFSVQKKSSFWRKTLQDFSLYSIYKWTSIVLNGLKVHMIVSKGCRNKCLVKPSVVTHLVTHLRNRSQMPFTKTVKQRCQTILKLEKRKWSVSSYPAFLRANRAWPLQRDYVMHRHAYASRARATRVTVVEKYINCFFDDRFTW